MIVTSAFRDVPYMGVIYVVAEAMKLGYSNGDPDWCNLGQGQPEVGSIDGAPPRIDTIGLDASDHAYGHVAGIGELRQSIAEHYNRLYRQGKRKFAAENVAVSAGGRLSLSRLLAALANGTVGYQVPDYTAYEDILDYQQHRMTMVVLPTKPVDGFVHTPEQLEAAVERHGLRTFLFSNPCNPTGQVIAGDALQEYCRIAREQSCTFIFDEFYSHFVYEGNGMPAPAPVSAAAYIDDIETDNIVLVDGLTKNYRYPGWRIGWVVGSSEAIEKVGRTASAIDGGPSTVAQRAALQVLQPERADQETTAVRTVFSAKRRVMLDGLGTLGFVCERPGRGTFYIWANVSELPAPLNNPDNLFRLALSKKVMTVPGRFFDVNPGLRRAPNKTYDQWVRLSYGPPLANVELGLSRLEDLIKHYRLKRSA